MDIDAKYFSYEKIYSMCRQIKIKNEKYIEKCINNIKHIL